MIVFERSEGEVAVLEMDGKIVEIEKSLLPDDVKEGDILKKCDGKYYCDKKATEERRKKINKLQNSLWG